MKAILTLVKIPYWLGSIFSANKSFGANPIIGSLFLNRCGLHIGRILITHAITHLKYLALAPLVSAEQRKQYREEGILIIPDFLESDTFELACKEIQSYNGTIQRFVQGGTATDRVRLCKQHQKDFPVCTSLLKENALANLMRYSGATLAPPLFYIQVIRHHFIKAKRDPQKQLHSDTFHPTMKSWLFLKDVTLDTGPFTYVKGSHKLTWSRLKWEYKKSLENSKSKVGGAFRASPSELNTYFMGKPTPILVPENTLVIVNTFGLHCRGEASGPQSRFEIWFHSRTNPFNPVSGLFATFMQKPYEKLLDKVIDARSKNEKYTECPAKWEQEFSAPSQQNN